MTHFDDKDIGDFAEEVLATLEGMRRALKHKLPGDIAASKERENKLKLMAVGILETLGRREPVPRRAKQLTFIDSEPPAQLPD